MLNDKDEPPAVLRTETNHETNDEMIDGTDTRVWESVDLEIQKQISIIYHRLKRAQIQHQLISDSISYYNHGKNRPNIETH